MKIKFKLNQSYLFQIILGGLYLMIIVYTANLK